MVSHCWNGPFGGQLGWQQMWAHDDKYKKKPWKKNKEQKEREVLARWMERTQLRAREGGNIQTCWMFLMSSLKIRLLKEASVCCRLRISPGIVLRCSGKREKTLKGEKSLLSLAGAGGLNTALCARICFSRKEEGHCGYTLCLCHPIYVDASQETLQLIVLFAFKGRKPAGCPSLPRARTGGQR